MYYLVIDISNKELENRLRTALAKANIIPSLFPSEGQPMLRLPDRSKIHGEKKILAFAEKLSSQVSAS